MKKKKGTKHAGMLGVGRAWLVSNEEEDPAYGLQSYLLLAHPPLDPGERRVHLALLSTFITGLQDVGELDSKFNKEELNVTWLPVVVGQDSLERAAKKRKPSAWADSGGTADLVSARVLAEVVLGHYDYARAMQLFALANQTGKDGPYVILLEHPLRVPIGEKDPCLVLSMNEFSEPEVKEVFLRYLEVSRDTKRWKPKNARSIFGPLTSGLGTIGAGVMKVGGALRFLNGPP